MSKCWWFWLLCVLFVNISSHLLGFVWFFKNYFLRTLTRSIDASTDFNTCVCVCFLFCFICLLFCNCIFLTKNKEITLELYFFPFRFTLLSPILTTVAQFLFCFECFYLLLPGAFLLHPSSSWMLHDFICLFLIKDTVNYVLTFLYSCSWIVLLCECIRVCVVEDDHFMGRKKCGWKLSEKNVKFKAKHSTISSPLSYFSTDVLSSCSLVHLYLILRLSHSRLAKLFTKYFCFFFFFVWSRSRSLSISLSTQTHIFCNALFADFFSFLFITTVACQLVTNFI